MVRKLSYKKIFAHRRLSQAPLVFLSGAREVAP